MGYIFMSISDYLMVYIDNLNQPYGKFTRDNCYVIAIKFENYNQAMNFCKKKFGVFNQDVW